MTTSALDTVGEPLNFSMELIVSYGADGTILCSSLRGNQLIRRWQGIPFCREHLCTTRTSTPFSYDYNLIVGINNKIFMWKWDQENVATRSVIMSGQNENCGLSVLTTSTNGYYIIAGTHAGDVMVWDADSGVLVTTFKAHTQQVSALAVSADSLWLATGGTDALIRVWSLPLLIATTRETNALEPSWERCWATFSAHSLPITTLCWIDLSLLASGSFDQALRLWDVPSQRALLTVTFQTPLKCITLSPSHDTLYVGGADGSIYVLHLWSLPGANDFTASSHTRRLTGHTAPLTALCTSVDGSVLISGSEDTTLRLWDTGTLQLIQTITRHKSPIVSVYPLFRPPSHIALQGDGTLLPSPRPLARWLSSDNENVTLCPPVLTDTHPELTHSLWHSTHSSLSSLYRHAQNNSPPTAVRGEVSLFRVRRLASVYCNVLLLRR